ncbi:MAG TPA: SMI1/KNR4 family protein [Candidatus Dormibacteraeota bacterium]|nr:SMI1/KNR4 family protein [Candidatus Dormibacteraeota bacterium]
MIDLLLQLEAELRRAAPDVAAKLLPGLEPDRIEALLAELPYPVPEEVRALYAWHNGTDYAYGAYRAEIYRGGMFLPLHEALSNRSGALGNTEGWDERWLPLFMDEHFLFHAVVCGPEGGAVVYFSYLDLPDFEVDYPSLSALVRSVIKRWQTGVYWILETGEVSLDPRALAALRREEDGADPDVAGLVATLHDGFNGRERDWSSALSRLRTRLYPSAVPLLVSLLADPSGHSHFYAVELLWAIQDPMALPALERAAREDAEENVRRYAQKAIREWGGAPT